MHKASRRQVYAVQVTQAVLCIAQVSAKGTKQGVPECSTTEAEPGPVRLVAQSACHTLAPANILYAHWR